MIYRMVKDMPPGPLHEMYSGLAEDYGIYTLLSFFLQFTVVIL